MRYLYGYQVDHIQSLDVLKQVKGSFSVTALRPFTQSYPCISVRLPVSYADATPPRPTPGHLASALAGVSKRVATNTPAPNRLVRRRFKRFVHLWLKHKSGLKPLAADQIMSFDEWLEGTAYSAGRKEELRKLWTRDGEKALQKINLRKVKAFIKDETYDVFKCPRGIYSRSDLAKCLFGPIVASVAKEVFKLPWFIKNVPVKDRPEVISKLYREGAEYIYTDYTAFESHFVKDLMDDCENELFRYMFANAPPEYKNAVDLMASVKGGLQNIIFKMFSCQQKAGRMSGEMDTSLSNGFTNLMLFLFASFEAGCPLDRIFGFVEGDDGIFRNDGPFPTERNFLDLGMTIKIGITKELNTASFCGQVYDIEDKAVVTDVREAVCRFGWTNKQYVLAKDNVLRGLLRAKGYSFVYQYGACPILGKLGAKLLQLTEGTQVRQSIIDHMDEWERTRYYEALKYGSQVREPGLNTRQLVEKLYGVSVVEQIDIETKIERMDDMGLLPFKFLTIPQEWVDYYDSYGVSNRNQVPVWRKSKFPLCDRLLDIGSITVQQYMQLKGASC